MTNIKVTMVEETSAPAPKMPPGVIVVTDAQGRAISIKKPKPLDGLDFKIALGSNHTNTLYLVEVSHLQYVCEIDGEAVTVPKTERELRALYQRLGDDGNSVAQAAVIENFFSEKVKAAEEAEVKNS